MASRKSGSKRAGTWSLARAARAAREARIATAAHLRDAPIARTWEFSKLATAHHMQVKQTGNRDAARALLFSGMGYREPYPETWEEASELVVSDEARYLAEAELYVLSPQMCDVVIAAAQTLTIDDLELLTAEDLPSPTGLVVLPHPVLIKAVNGHLGDDRAFHWHSPIDRPTMGTDGTWRDLPAVRLASYHDTNGPVRPDSFQDVAARARAQGTPLPPLLLDSVRLVPFGCHVTGEQRDALDEFAEAARQTGQRLRDLSAEAGRDEDKVIGEYRPGDEIVDHDDTFNIRFLYAFWRLCEQRTTVTSNGPTGHAAQVLAERAGVSPEVRVVQLRQPDTHRAETSPARDWKHRWPVRMHKVRQWYPSEQRHKVIMRGPYIKGPADKPLLGGEVVRGLTR